MKKSIRSSLGPAFIALVLIAALAFSLSACSATSNTATSTDTLYMPSVAESYSDDYYSYSNDYSYPDAEMAIMEEMGTDTSKLVSSGAGLTSVVAAPTAISFAEKIIYSAYASVETILFEDAVAALNDMITQYDAFVEYSYITGADYRSTYYGYNPMRNANYTIRVPRENYSALTNSLSTLGNVTNTSSNAENVTEHYTDVDARLKVYLTEESRLLIMLEKADNIEDMITIESKLSEVRYDIERLTATLRDLDNRVNYSTVTVDLREVEELTQPQPVHRTYGQQIADGFKESMRAVGNFFKNLAKAFIVNLPVLLLIAVVVVIALLILRRVIRRLKAKFLKARKTKSAADIPNHDENE